MDAISALPRRRAVFAIYLCASVAYLAWRFVATRNPGSPIWSWTFLLLEAYAVACSCFFYLVILDRTERSAPPPRRGLGVDVLVCSYNEPLALVRQTLRRALALDYPHRTWLCDDGNRAEARVLATALGCGYLARSENTDYKAGNLNHALAHTTGEFLVVLDADHLLRPDFLDRLLGYFDDPQVALVQTPQSFYNIDSFQHHFVARHRRLWHEGAIFHHAIQPGADRWNAAFFVGTGAILRRAALEKVSGFAIGTVTEDCHTSLRLHAAGFRSVYHDEALGYLQAPQSLLQYLTQRLRWGQGSMQILRQENPLFLRGLTLRQRLVYANSLSSFAQAIVHVAYYLAPALFLFGAAAPLRLSSPWQFAPLAVHIAIDLLAFRFFLGPLARPLLSECYKFLNVYCFLKAIGGYFRKERLRFEVTNKSRDASGSISLLAPQMALVALNATGFAIGCLRLASGGTVVELLGLAFATFFAGTFVIVGGTATLFALRRLAAHSEYTFPDNIPGQLASGARVTVVRANAESMVLLLAPAPLSPGAPLRLGAQLVMKLQLEGAAIEVTGRIASLAMAAARARDDVAPQPAVLATIELDPLSEAARDRLFDRLALVDMPRVAERLGLANSEAPPLTLETEEAAWFLPVEPNVL